MLVQVEKLVKYYDQHAACNQISFRLESGRLAGLLGPSGGGKTTLLRMLAGLETPDSGTIFFDGKRVNDVPPQRRGIGFVFQSYALFKHMTVYENIAFGLTVQKKQTAAIRGKVEELLSLTGLQGLERRYPDQLSGGQRQRVAFARALAPDPQLLLLDEPFSAIDAQVRKELRVWLKAMIRRFGVTTIFVTHDQAEAIEVADDLLIIQSGNLEQFGTPIDIYHSPRSPFVAKFVGESDTILCPWALRGFETAKPGTSGIVRPEFIDVGREREIAVPSAAERGVVRDVFFRGSSWLIEIALQTATGPQMLYAYRSLQFEPLQPGDDVCVLIHRMYLYEQEEMRLVTNMLKEDPMPVII